MENVTPDVDAGQEGRKGRLISFGPARSQVQYLDGDERRDGGSRNMSCVLRVSGLGGRMDWKGVLEAMQGRLEAAAAKDKATTAARISRGECPAPAAWTLQGLVFLKKPDALLEIALVAVLAEWYAAVVVGLLHEESEPIERKMLQGGAERGINCERMQAPLTNSCQRHWE